ncbi:MULTISPECIES: cutinase family protein [unclassified Nocardia]|uniref:cutinase family protein n=1 Tax=unclassified Nocardia TaxID=2637762 RepID=UPI001CE4B214|nr:MULTISPECIES: cutinase family protein [unclassified Nocardia]
MSAKSTRYLVTTMTAVGVAAGLAAAPAPAHAETAGCATTFNLFIPGTWETDEHADPARPTGMLGPIAEAVQRAHGTDSDIYFTPYMARAFDNGHTYADSKSTALSNARTALRNYETRCPAARFTITGYSQGADAAGDLAADIGNGRGPVSADRVIAVGLLADPGAGTNGESEVGPRSSGTGIADPRAEGMGKLSGRVVSICDPGDLYCSIEKGDNPFLGLLGSVLSKTRADGSRLASALTSDFSKADLPGLAAALNDLTAALDASDGLDLTRIRSSAGKLAGTIDPLADLLGSGAANQAATARLDAAPAGTPENSAGQVLAGAAQSDLADAASALRSITDTADRLLNGGTATLSTDSPDATALSGAIDALNGQLAPLTATPPDVLGSASGILPTLKTSAFVDQTLDAASAVSTMDFAGIGSDIALLVQQVATGDAQSASRTATDLNNRFQPLLKGSVDFDWISKMLSAAPDTHGYASSIARLTAILSKVDFTKLAKIVGQIQDVATSVLAKLAPPPGQRPDADGAAAALAGLKPVGRDLAAMLQQVDTQSLADALGGLLAYGAVDFGALIGDGLSAATFVTSGAHINYNSLVVDDTGRTAIQWLGDWLNGQIG